MSMQSSSSSEEEEFYSTESNIFWSTEIGEFDGSESNEDTEEVYNVRIDDVEIEAWRRFGDDFPAMTKTMDRLHEALDSLNNKDYPYNPEYDQYLKNIQNQIKMLLAEYDDIYDGTNELIQIIQEVYSKNNGERKLLFSPYSKAEQLYNEENEDKMDIDRTIRGLFGGDIEAIKVTMQRLRESINALNNYYDISDEYKISLNDKMMELLNEYKEVIVDTNILIEMIEEFSLMMNNE